MKKTENTDLKTENTEFLFVCGNIYCYRFLKIFSGFPRSIFQILTSTLIPCCTSHLLFLVEQSYWQLPSYLSKWGSPSIQRHVQNDIPCTTCDVSKYNMRCYIFGMIPSNRFVLFFFFWCLEHLLSSLRKYSWSGDFYSPQRSIVTES